MELPLRLDVGRRPRRRPFRDQEEVLDYLLAVEVDADRVSTGLGERDTKTFVDAMPAQHVLHDELRFVRLDELLAVGVAYHGVLSMGSEAVGVLVRDDEQQRCRNRDLRLVENAHVDRPTQFVQGEVLVEKRHLQIGLLRGRLRSRHLPNSSAKRSAVTIDASSTVPIASSSASEVTR